MDQSSRINNDGQEPHAYNPSGVAANFHRKFLESLARYQKDIIRLVTMDDKQFQEYLQEVEKDLRKGLTDLRESRKQARLTDQPLSQPLGSPGIIDDTSALPRTFSGDTISEELAVFSGHEIQPVTIEELLFQAQRFTEQINNIFKNNILGEKPKESIAKIESNIQNDPYVNESIDSLFGEYGMLNRGKFEESITGEKLFKSRKTDKKVIEQTNETNEINRENRALRLVRSQLRSSFEEEIGAISENPRAFRALVRQTVEALGKAIKISEDETEHFRKTVASIYKNIDDHRNAAEALYQFYEEYEMRIRSRGKICKSMRIGIDRVWRSLNWSKPTILQLKKKVVVELKEPSRRYAHLEGKHDWKKLRENTALGREAENLRMSIETDAQSKGASILASQESLKRICLHRAIAFYVDRRVKAYESTSVSDAEKNKFISQASLALGAFSADRLLFGQEKIISNIHGTEARMYNYMDKMHGILLEHINRAGNTPLLTTLNDFASDMGLPIGSAGLVLSALGAAGILS